jgi:hypothetical protein
LVKNVETKGTVGDHLCTIERTMRGGDRSRKAVATMAMPSSGTCPELLATMSALPLGMFSTPIDSARK